MKTILHFNEDEYCSKPSPVIGCVVFDDASNEDGSATASIGSGNSFRVKKPTDLDRGYIWVSNTGKAAFGGSNEYEHPWIRRTNFLGTPISSVFEEISATDLSIETRVSIGSEILTRVASRLSEFYESCIPEMFGETLSSTIRGKIIGDSSLLTQDDDPIILNAITFAVSSLGDSTGMGVGRNDVLLRIAANRVPHAMNSITVPSPVGSWRVLQGRLPRSREIAEMMAPSLSLVSIVSGDASFLELLPKNGGLGQMIWVTHPEMQIISSIAKIEVEKVYLADSYLGAAGTFRQAVPEPIPADYSSVSSGLAYESILGAATLPDIMNGIGGNVYGPRAAWILSQARSYMMMDAMLLVAAGVPVVDFGTSHVTVSIGPKSIDKLNIALNRCKNLINPNINPKTWRKNASHR